MQKKIELDRDLILGVEWHAVVNKNGELISVGPTEGIAQTRAINSLAALKWKQLEHEGCQTKIVGIWDMSKGEENESSFDRAMNTAFSEYGEKLREKTGREVLDE